MRLKIIFSLLAVGLIVSCSTQENKFANRNYHAMTTYYNVLYHGNIELQLAVQDIKNKHLDHYFDILPIERMAELPPERNDTVPLNEFIGNAERKATKGIQKHSIFLGGKEYNFQVDEAYLLLGKARYFDKRYIPAKDAFSFIVNHYPDSEIITKAKIWQEKTNMRLDYDELAIKNLLKIVNETPEIDEEDLAEVFSTIAQVYINLEQYEKAIEPLEIAVQNVSTYDEKARWTYIKGQLFVKLEMKDSAVANFQRVIDYKRRPPRDYLVHATMENFKLHGYTPEETAYVKEYLTKTVEDWENRNHLDVFHFEFAEHFLRQDSIDLAIKHYNKSLRNNPKSQYMTSRNYLNLAEIYFDRASYKTAGDYYDSTLVHIPKKEREYRLIKKKRDNLDEVIKYEAIAVETDSILKIVGMDEKEQLAFFTKYTDKLKEEAKSMFAQQKLQDRLANMATPEMGTMSNMGGLPGSRGGSGGGSAVFYFYNPAQIGSGKNKFKRKWGDIELADDWRLKGQKKGAKKSDEEEDKEEEDDMFADPQFDPQTYIAQIPKEQPIIDSIHGERSYAYFQLGVIYKEKFREYELAVDRFTKMLGFDPVDEKLELPGMFNMYLIYKQLEDDPNMLLWKNKILDEHPDSRYADVLRNPRSLRDGEDSPNKVYMRLYKRYQAQDLEGLLAETSYWTEEFTGTPMVPKFELLKALIKGRLYGFKEYTESLEQVALDYPQTKEGKKAQEIFTEAKQKMTQKNFVKDGQEDKFKLVFMFDAEEYPVSDLQFWKMHIHESLIDMGYEGLKTSADVYTNDENFLLVHGLSSKLGAQGMAELLKKEEVILKDWLHFEISNKNYTILQIHKTKEEYIQSQN